MIVAATREVYRRAVLPSRAVGTHAVGVDMIEIGRVAGVLQRHPRRFLDRVYTPEEVAFCRGRVQELAARFAAKEAVMKALGTGARSVAWRDIEVLPDRRGKPLVYLTGGAAQRASEIGLDAIDISLSHLEEFAIAVVVCSQAHREQEPEAARARLVEVMRMRGMLA
jgi:holo-[acyl-carrier protein] synthase